MKGDGRKLIPRDEIRKAIEQVYEDIGLHQWESEFISIGVEEVAYHIEKRFDGLK